MERYDELKGINWQWQVLDSATVKAPLGGEKTGPNPTDRGKRGNQRRLITEGAGIPTDVAISGANRHDMKWWIEWLPLWWSVRARKSRSSICALTRAMTSLRLVQIMAERGYQVSLNVVWIRPPLNRVIPIGILPDDGWSNGRIAGSTASARCWSGGRKRLDIGWASSSSPPA